MLSKGLVYLLIRVEIWWLMITVVVSDPQTKLLKKGCSIYNATCVRNFDHHLEAVLFEIETKLNDNHLFATAERTTAGESVYAMVQCRNYMSTHDCIGCFTAAHSLIRNCSAANGAHVIYDGCFLRYESNNFYQQTTLPGNAAICGNQTASHEGTAFQKAVEALISDLAIAAPRTHGFYVAYKKELMVGGGKVVYGVAQCAETTTPSACQNCLKVAHEHINSCLPSTNGRAVDAGCFLRYSDTAFFSDNQTTNITPFLEMGDSTRNRKIIGVVGVVGLLILISVLFLWCRQSRKAKAAPRGDILGATEFRGPVNYSYRELKAATKNFSAENKLGEGGFGGVYKGILKNGKMVAVKKLFIGQQPNRVKADFESEVKLISNIHHRNLIRLLGCCCKGSELLLVYEYMANSSLDKFLFGGRRGALNWRQRLDIIAGTARGLAYLHEEFHVCIIHRDIKSSNILLDNDFQPKIADFGLARLLPGDKSHLSTKFAGTLGYTAPEYAIHGKLCEKNDTYSYGVVVLEIISGRKCNETKAEPAGEYLLERAWKLYEEDKHLELVDESLDPDEYEAEEVKKIIEIALMCAQSSVSMRPAMSEIVVLLSSSKGSVVDGRGPPTRPIFVESGGRIRTHGGDNYSTSTAGSSASNATVSVTPFSGR